LSVLRKSIHINLQFAHTIPGAGTQRPQSSAAETRRTPSQRFYPDFGDKMLASEGKISIQRSQRTGGQIMNNNFAKGIGIGMVVGSAIGVTLANVGSRTGRQSRSKVGKALRTVGDIVENIGSAFNM
jgi:hypothetical protein